MIEKLQYMEFVKCIIHIQVNSTVCSMKCLKKIISKQFLALTCVTDYHCLDKYVTTVNSALNIADVVDKNTDRASAAAQ